jgi:hypothetical protein
MSGLNYINTARDDAHTVLRGGHIKTERGITFSDGYSWGFYHAELMADGSDHVRWLAQAIERGETVRIIMEDCNDLTAVSECMALCEREFGFIPPIVSQTVDDAYQAARGYRGTSAELTAELFASIALECVKDREAAPKRDAAWALLPEPRANHYMWDGENWIAQ